MMDLIERTVAMPQGADHLHHYSRFYAWGKNRRRVEAVYLHGSDYRRWVHLDKLPAISDGGCRIIDVVFDVETSAFGISCHGLA
jgi:hypothetical protein